MNATKQIEEFLGEKITSTNSVGGGCIADSRIIKTESGKSYFLKTLSGDPEVFRIEANGLKELAKPNCIAIPKVILAGDNFLILENIVQGAKSSSFFSDFGRAFAKMHKYTAAEFGFFENNYIGASPQYNIAQGEEKTNWATFYYNKRLLAQLQMAEKSGFATRELHDGIFQLGEKIHKILDGSKEPPTLLHGDLWGGNFMCNQNGDAVLIDPAVYYGHREADLAMTKMFGGFTSDFYTAYQKEYPLPDMWQYRENIYLLYHYLNHLNLFGNSYYGTAMQLINFYL